MKTDKPLAPCPEAQVPPLLPEALNTAQLQTNACPPGSAAQLGDALGASVPNEAWHLFQKAQGRVLPTRLLCGDAVTDGPGLEQEADSLGRFLFAAKQDSWPSKL